MPFLKGFDSVIPPNKLYIASKIKRMQFRLLVVCLLLFMVSCKSKQMIEPIKVEVPRMSESKLLKKYKAKSFEDSDIKTVKINAKMSYKIGDSSHKLGLKFRIAKGEKIWMSADFLGIPVVKMLIEKDSVHYYNKFDKTYFEGSFDFIKDLIGVDVSYGVLEKLFMGDMILNIASKRYRMDISQDSYFFYDAKNLDYFIEGSVYPFTYKTKSQVIEQAYGTNKFAAYYKTHQTVNDFLFPKVVELQANNKGKITVISMVYNDVTFDEHLTFPYKVPKECDKKIELKSTKEAKADE
ncbi:DUF4292 domain-containing protein [Wenyingzhuangia aestuarii]|uniref:DUF4292 domain-containing protein n=1 Tax=Wenyingzhuangia aestuarii TaxID=1647582 RepID=UPI00143C51F7|nr:DUF4292 domain-containing protein [Wenyingzhuangia aestuarii]NJB81425.1 hypothetical protein [Wenyingzhuangia aestuarii]